MNQEQSATRAFVRLLKIKREIAEAKSNTGITPLALVERKAFLQAEFDRLVNEFVTANIDNK